MTEHQTDILALCFLLWWIQRETALEYRWRKEKPTGAQTALGVASALLLLSLLWRILL